MLTEAAEAEGRFMWSRCCLTATMASISAIMAGFSHVTGDLIITLDADLQNPPEEIRAWWRRRTKVTTWSVPFGRTAVIPSSAKARRR